MRGGVNPSPGTKFGEDEDVVWDGTSWFQLGGKPKRKSRFKVAELLCGSESESDKEVVQGFWWDRWINGSPILNPECFVNPLGFDSNVDELP